MTIPVAEARTTAVPAEEQPWWADWVRLRSLLERGRGDLARELVKELAVRWPEVEHIQHYARVLEPPVARVVPGLPSRSLDKDYAWIREHAREYPGRWLAVFEDRLIAADPDLDVVTAAARRELGDRPASLIYVPERQG